MHVRVGPWRKLRTKELLLLNCVVRKDSSASLRLQRDPTSQSSRKSVLTFIGRTDDEAEAPTLWPPDAKNWLFRKDPDTGKDWRQEEKGMTEDEVVRCHHRLDGHEFEKALGVSVGHGSLVCYSPWGSKESDMTEWLNSSSHFYIFSPSTYKSVFLLYVKSYIYLSLIFDWEKMNYLVKRVLVTSLLY